MAADNSWTGDSNTSGHTGSSHRRVKHSNPAWPHSEPIPGDSNTRGHRKVKLNDPEWAHAEPIPGDSNTRGHRKVKQNNPSWAHAEPNPGDSNAGGHTGSGHRRVKQNDPAWAHAEPIPGLRNSMICLHCGKKISGGGITRFKYHLSGVRGQVEICQKVPEDIRNHMKQLVECLSSNSTENKTKRKRKRKSLYEIVSFNPDLDPDPQNFTPDPLTIQNYDPDPLGIQNYDPDPNEEEELEQEEEEEQEEPEPPEGNFVISRKCRVRSKKQRYNNNHLPPQIVTPIASRNGSGLLDPFQTARLAIARWWYDSKVPFEGARSSYYNKMIESIINVGPGFDFKGPSYHDLRGPLLKDIRDEIKEYLFGVRNVWRLYGCSIMVDRLVNKENNNQIIINFLIFSPRGTVFLKSVDVGTGTGIGTVYESNLVEIFDEVIREVGPENVVQFITDPDGDFKAAGTALQDRYGTFFWSPCAAHCIDLMLENFSDPRYFSNIEETLKKAREITRFIYNHAWVLSLMRRDFTNGSDLIRPGPTRFATRFVTLQSLLKYKKELRQMFTSPKFLDSEFGKSESGNEISGILFRDKDFWTQCQHIVRITEPLIRVLKLVDSDSKPSMGHLYEAMEGAKESIRKRSKNKTSLYTPYLRVIENFWDKLLFCPIHAAGAFLNPGVYFRNGFGKQEVSRGLLVGISRMVKDYETQDMISAQLEEYKDATGDFGLPIAVRQREKLNPVAWWEQFGNDTPELQRFAIRVLSQCCSATGRERNWASFQFLHSKKQNSIEYKRLNDLVFVRYNLKLRERNTRNKEVSDPISLENIDLLDEWVSEEAGLLTGEDLSWDSLEPPVCTPTGEDQDQASDSVEEHATTTTEEDFNNNNNNNNKPLVVKLVNCVKTIS